MGAHAVAGRALPAYSHRFSPKTYTQHQFFACLVLKSFLKLDYRGLAALLTDTSDLARAIGLTRIPHFTAFQKASQRLLTRAKAHRLLTETLRRLPSGKRPKTQLAAIDSSGFEAQHTSHYLVHRRARNGKTSHDTTYRRWAKLTLVCDCRTHLILAAVPGRGPGPDLKYLDDAVVQAWVRTRMGTVLADAGYDAEWSHELLRHDLGVRSIIPPLIGRRTDKPPAGAYRREMWEAFDRKTYGQRWQVETVFSMIKRRQGSTVDSRSYWAQCRALLLKALTHNILIRRCRRGFLQSTNHAKSKTLSHSRKSTGAIA